MVPFADRVSKAGSSRLLADVMPLNPPSPSGIAVPWHVMSASLDGQDSERAPLSTAHWSGCMQTICIFIACLGWVGGLPTHVVRGFDCEEP